MSDGCLLLLAMFLFFCFGKTKKVTNIHWQELKSLRILKYSNFKLELNKYSITVKPKTFKPNLLDEPKDVSSLEFFLSLSMLF